MDTNLITNTNSNKISKWIAVLASIWIQCTCGSSYAFGIYSPLLKTTQSYDQSTLDMVAVFKDIGANAGILSGLLYSSDFGRRKGPWVVHVAGAVQCFVGYFFIWLSVEGIVEKPHVGWMCLFIFLAAHAQTFFNTANVVTAVKNFPDYSGTIVGIMKGFLGLSGSMLIQLYYAVLNGNPSKFLLMLALLPTVTSLVFMCFVQISPTNSKEDKKHLDGFSSIAMILAAYLLIIIVLENLLTFSSWARIFTFIVLLLLLASPLKIGLRAREKELETSSQMPSDVRSPLLSEGHDQEIGDDDLQTGKELNLVQSACTLDFWLLFIAMLCGMGSGLATINNISQIGQSLNYRTIEINTLVSLWSIWNFLGRFGAGYVSDLFLYTKGWARPLFMVCTLITMTAGHIIIASGFSGNLYVGSVIVGICYGSQWSLMPTISSEIFGVTHMGTIFNTIAIASPVGSSILSVLVVGNIYDREASAESGSCYGAHCFMVSFFVLASFTLLGSFVALLLFFRTRMFYRQLLQRRQRHLA